MNSARRNLWGMIRVELTTLPYFFKNIILLKVWRCRLSVRTAGFQPAKLGSTPCTATIRVIGEVVITALCHGAVKSSILL